MHFPDIYVHAYNPQWCIGDPIDLDLYMFTPEEEGGNYVTDRQHAVYWGVSPKVTPAHFYQGLGAERGGATFSLENDDVGEVENTRTFGPESIFIKGRPMPGK